ncbi:unnamed protein product [Clonostachys rosea f. rosea IK726]|uniref:AMP-dependent synthetase/ligase domain-containing protein n=3 Tax=Bionectria ochroleuca TaxID=29856 RepID=A0A0B7K9I9_BIOOC|nr:unnamed protein product [Clonostachys rosea f. rosea IK726]
MVFRAPSWAPQLNDADIPDHLPLSDFLFNDELRPQKCADSPTPFIDSLDGSGSSIEETRKRIEWLAAGIATHLGITDTTGDVWDRVVSVFTVNNIHTPVLAWAVHRFNGVVAPANVAFRASELAYQLKDCKARCIFTDASHLDIALEAATGAGISSSNVLLVSTPADTGCPSTNIHSFSNLEDLVNIGRRTPPLPHTRWEKGRARKQPAYLCYSSGTSGSPKGVMVSHRNIIANIMQMTLYELPLRNGTQPEVILGILPQSHIYSIILTTHCSVFRGDTVIVAAKFELRSLVKAIRKFKMTMLYVVPPILIALIKQGALTKDPTEFDLPSVKRMYCGAAPLSEELSSQIKARYPHVLLGQGYGMTESATVMASHPREVYDGSSGCVLPGLEIRLVDAGGNDVEGHNQPGEIWARGPNITLGYFKNSEATVTTYSDGWLRSGDVGEFRLHPKTGDAHLFIVDRVKELIKVSGFQVAPAELEGHLLSHSLVDDCAVIPVADERSGEVPKAVVVLSKDAGCDHRTAESEILDWVATHKSKHKHLKGGVDFVSEIPKSPSGKILRRLLRDREKDRQAQISAKL